MRLDVLLAKARVSRKEMKRALLQKKILVDGLPAQKLSQNVDTDLQVVTFMAQKLPATKHHYFLMNKPACVVTANKDRDKPTVMDLLRPADYNDQLYAIGRLDRDTRGLLLITDNGPLGFQLLHPQYHVKKTYYVEVNGLLSQKDVESFEQGIVFKDGTSCQPAELVIHDASSQHSSASVTLRQGKFHQVKKMFLSVGVKVTYLKRTHFGTFTLDPDLAEGDYRPLSKKELQLIKNYLEKTS